MKPVLREIESILAVAVEMDSEAGRREFLDQACAGDADLKRRVEELIENHFRAGSFLESPAADLFSTADDRLSEHSGTVIGPYKLLEQIGEGGFGIVFMAEQQHPVRRKVALKVIKPGMDSKQIIARFEAERQALAMMDHQNIARVLDAGATDSGRPYFIMELVRGIPITQFCDDNRLTLRERLELFLAVCQAVQHAHQKGIIHRDLKPSNVLVTLHDGTPVVKVIDFGIAKALGQQRLTDKTLVTGFAQMIGTPLYMSPEQAEMSGLDADTRTDIYSLGVLLYELLTGTTPFDKHRLKEASYEEIRRIIREEEPAKPSTRMSTLGQAAATVSANRKSEPRRLSQLFRGELDWIVMKALEKDRNRRYDTVSSFAADVQRYLHDEPVQACPPSAVYRFRKFARRNKAALMTTATIASAVTLALAGLAVSTVLVWRANNGLSDSLERERQNSYFQRIALAERESSANNLSRTDELLDACPADLRGWEWHYLKGLRLHSIPPLAHPKAVLCAAFSADGRCIATGSQDGMVTIWDASTWHGKPFSAHEQQVRSLAFSPNGRLLATASWDTTVKVWELDPSAAGAVPRLIRPLPHQAKVHRVSFSPDSRLLASGGDDKTVHIWNAATGEEIMPLRGHAGPVWSVQFSPDGRWLASASQDASVRIWDVHTGQQRHALPHSQSVNDVAFSLDGTRLASAEGNFYGLTNGEVKVWDVHDGQLLLTLPGHVTGSFSVTFSRDGRILASGGRDGNVRLWHVPTGQQLLTLRDSPGFVVRSLAFSPDGNQLTAGGESTVRVWDARPIPPGASQETFTLRSDGAPVRSSVFSADGRILASAGDSDTIQLWDLQLGLAGIANPLPRTLPGHVGLATGAVFSRDGRLFATASRRGHQAGRLTVWDVATWKEFYSDDTVGFPLAFSPDSQYLAGVSSDFTIEVLEASTGRKVRTIEKAHSWAIYDLAFRPNSKVPCLASGSVDGTVRIWDVTTGKQMREPLGHDARVLCVAFSPDGCFLASGVREGFIKIWDARTWQLLREIPDPTGSVQSVVFDPQDGRVLAWGSTDGTVKVMKGWDAATRETRTLSGHTSWVQSVAFSPDGKQIASASADGTVKIWRTPLLPE
jgi:WD40 repeat protein/serine/threonine protein kinase